LLIVECVAVLRLELVVCEPAEEWDAGCMLAAGLLSV
jgi:hypothetical protein